MTTYETIRKSTPLNRDEMIMSFVTIGAYSH